MRGDVRVGVVWLDGLSGLAPAHCDFSKDIFPTRMRGWNAGRSTYFLAAWRRTATSDRGDMADVSVYSVLFSARGVLDAW
jgi:hypothetical protein